MPDLLSDTAVYTVYLHEVWKQNLVVKLGDLRKKKTSLTWNICVFGPTLSLSANLHIVTL